MPIRVSQLCLLASAVLSFVLLGSGCKPGACLRASDCAGGEMCLDNVCTTFSVDSGSDTPDASTDAHHDAATDAHKAKDGAADAAHDGHHDSALHDGALHDGAVKDGSIDGDAHAHDGHADAPDASRDAARICIPGQQISCECANLALGVESCEPSGTQFSACVCADASAPRDGAAKDAAADVGSRTCVPGQGIECACPGGKSGQQVCAASGDDYGPCSCTPIVDGAYDGPRVCTPGSELTCPCPTHGVFAKQVCAPSGAYFEACGCGDGGSEIPDGGPDAPVIHLCVPGNQVACTCSDGATGVHDCLDSGTGFGTCQCESATATDAGHGSDASTSDAGKLDATLMADAPSDGSAD